jgi:uncharacterized protein
MALVNPHVGSGFSRTLGAVLLVASVAAADAPLPILTEPVHDLANVIDGESEAGLGRLSRALLAATGDTVVVVTVPSFEPYADIREYAVKLFENHGRGIGGDKDNGLLIVLALRERSVWVEVGYGLEGWITDGFAGETSRQYMVPEFRNGRYGPGLVAGASRIVARIAEGRGVTLTDVEPVRTRPRVVAPRLSFTTIVIIFLAIVTISRWAGGPGRPLRRRGGWSGWSSTIGPFGTGGWNRGGGWTSGRSSGGGFGGGFGGFGGGRSGGGGGGARW